MRRVQAKVTGLVRREQRVTPGRSASRAAEVKRAMDFGHNGLRWDMDFFSVFLQRDRGHFFIFVFCLFVEEGLGVIDLVVMKRIRE